MINSKGLIFLESKSAILHEQLSLRILEEKRVPCEIAFSDFDDVSFKISCAPESLGIITVHMSMRNLPELRRMGSQSVIDKAFPNLEVTPDEGYNLAIKFDCDNLSDPKIFLDNICEIKKLVFGGPMDAAFTALQKNLSIKQPVFAIEYRNDENLFICPTESKVVVIFQVDFMETTDKEIAKIFLQEFVEAQRLIRSAPPVSYSKDPPGELLGVNYKYNPESAGFISFALEGRHIEGNKKEIALTLLVGFRNYLHYHIKCTKTYLHMRMRKKGAGWMQVLNRAIPDIEIEKKTIAGKTFTRK